LGKLNPKIDNISISKDKLVSLKKAIQHYEGMNGQISDIIKNIVGGVCIICHGIPVKKLTYQMNGVTKIEWYCAKYFTKL